MMDDNRFAPQNNEMADYFLFSKTSVKSETEESVDCADNEEILALPIKRKNIKQPSDLSGKFYKTLPGFMINYLENQGETMESDLIRVVQENLPYLRNSSGSLYKNSAKKCLNGVAGMGCFAINNEVWALNPREVEMYRERFLFKAKRIRKPKVTEKKGLRKTERIVSMLRKFSGQLAKDPRTERLTRDPLKEVMGTEDLQEAASKIGYERLIGILQAYSVVSKHFIMLIHKEKASIQFENIEKDIQGIYSKLSRIEDHLSRPSKSENKSSLSS